MIQQFLNTIDNSVLDIGQLKKLTNCSLPPIVGSELLKSLKNDLDTFENIFIILDEKKPDDTEDFRYEYVDKYSFKGVFATKTYAEIKKDYDEKKADVLFERKRRYPDVGEQLDAIMKWLSTETEFTIPAELKSIAMKCMSVKANNPKPKKDLNNV